MRKTKESYAWRAMHFKPIWNQIIIAEMGPLVCSECGYSRCESAIEFHHKYEKKSFTIASWIIKNPDEDNNILKFKEELKKCIMLCANCHRELHEDQRNRNFNKLTKVKTFNDSTHKFENNLDYQEYISGV